ncbi:hypothetical protein B0T10DRAFT_36859 [Thelonectria olida]|uniref:Uncharacterized protein n=1 Tax=Thelonectria olida TaxID=1576542 RepID=A0A9P8WIY5_9HYPO|nr:hypothetical protein B0T10DRAFT_36859 [Thelonectria olida]
MTMSAYKHDCVFDLKKKATYPSRRQTPFFRKVSSSFHRHLTLSTSRIFAEFPTRQWGPSEARYRSSRPLLTRDGTYYLSLISALLNPTHEILCLKERAKLSIVPHYPSVQLTIVHLSLACPYCLPETLSTWPLCCATSLSAQHKHIDHLCRTFGHLYEAIRRNEVSQSSALPVSEYRYINGATWKIYAVIFPTRHIA